jgi:hypothetical protein
VSIYERISRSWQVFDSQKSTKFAKRAASAKESRVKLLMDIEGHIGEAKEIVFGLIEEIDACEAVKETV